MDFKNLNFTDFVRYSLTGLNFILFVILLPAIYFAPGLIKDLVSETSVLTILLFSIAIGFLMDMLKVYQFAPKYSRNKIAFRKKSRRYWESPLNRRAAIIPSRQKSGTSIALTILNDGGRNGFW
jgi:hypothetical protein